mmetsp:Transcript_103466/g.163295  ORF Transcript_103466/g.163295 Transcript_103466/m.163295 type:complete len:292 (-) Transcript_103466:397-1272(-)
MDGLPFVLRALLCAGTSALGSLPISLVGKMTDMHMGACISVAAGMMLGCSVVLAIESLLASSCLALVCGFVAGVALIHSIEWLLEGRENLTFGDLKGSDAAGGLVIFCSLVLHSLGEGLSIGVSAMEVVSHEVNSGLNSVVLISLAIHNIPEGMATCMCYMSKGMSIKRAAFFAFISNLPQPISALLSFCCVQQLQAMELAIPIGLGMASGAMCCVVFKELAPEALEKLSVKHAVPIMVLSGSFVIFFDMCMHLASSHDALLREPLVQGSFINSTFAEFRRFNDGFARGEL